MRRLSGKAIVVAFALLMAITIMPLTTYAYLGEHVPSGKSGWTRYDDKDSRITYSTDTGWGPYVHSGPYGGSIANTAVAGAYFEFEFTGTRFNLIGDYTAGRTPLVTVYVDGEQIGTFSERYSNNTNWRIIVYESPVLTQGMHTVKVVNSGGSFTFDAIDLLNPSSFGDVTPPDRPQGLDAVANDGSVDLTWQTVSAGDLQGYNIYRNGAKIAGPITGNSYTAAATNNTQYTWQVSAVDDVGNESARSDSVNTIFDTISPIAPIGLVSNPQAGGQTLLTWTPNNEPDLAGYNVYQDDVKRNGSLIVPPEYLVTGLDNNRTYSFTVTAVDLSNNESPKSTAVTYYFDANAPTAPAGLTGTADMTTIDLTWEASDDTDVIGYNVYRDGIKQNGSLIAGTTYTVEGLEPGKTYRFTVRSVDDANNESVSSNTLTIATTELPKTTPRNVKAQSGSGIITVRWDAVAGATEYRIYRDGDLTATQSGNAYSDSDVENGSVYEYRISAVIDGIEYELSDPARARPGNHVTFDPDLAFGNVMDAIATGFSFLAKYRMYILIVLGIIFAPLAIGFLQWLFGKLRKAPQKKPPRERKQLTPEEKERRTRERKLNKARDEKYDYLTRTGRTSERDAWVKQTGYLNKEQRQERARQERTKQAREAREGRQVVYRSTGERDSHGNRIRRKEYVGREPRNGRR